MILQAKVGDHLTAGEPLIEIHARNEQEALAIQDSLLASYQWSETAVQAQPLICDVIHP
ncbi:hypothetical protein [Dictyobacter kobayashii]|uniref:Uncharacterized protein n=1 Tax=Dictyobacter kobayashii TaxID=2014872 RepID=A0A402AG87_9CHLR|nr:hypothetical protein [Dictyobacter kobayashii]GCE18140.1 hypothetical protein KDK_19400 [Dictyobacter kobayashii]